MSDSSPTNSSVLSAEHTGALRARIQKLVTMWADEEQMAGNKVFYWNILNGEQMKEIATKVPTNLEELSECMLSPKAFKKSMEVVFSRTSMHTLNWKTSKVVLRIGHEKSTRQTMHRIANMLFRNLARMILILGWRMTLQAVHTQVMDEPRQCGKHFKLMVSSSLLIRRQYSMN